MRFARSLPRPRAEEEGLAGEAVMGNGTTTLIPGVDASKVRMRGLCPEDVPEPVGLSVIPPAATRNAREPI